MRYVQLSDMAPEQGADMEKGDECISVIGCKAILWVTVKKEEHTIQS